MDEGELTRELAAPTLPMHSVPLLWVLTCARLAHAGEGRHAHLLHTGLAALGLTATAGKPPWASKLVTRGVRFAPGWLRSAILLDMGTATCVVLAHLLRLVRPLFGQQPAPCDRLESALGEVLSGELQEIELLRARMSRPSRWIAAAIRRFVVAAFADAVPEIDPLIGRERLLYACSSFNPETAAASASKARGAASMRPRPGGN